MRSFFFCLDEVSARLDAEFLRELDQVELHEQLADRLGAHVGVEGPLAVLLAGLAVFVLGEELVRLQGRVAGARDDVVLEIDDLFQARGLHGQQAPQAAGHGLEEPDMHDRRGELDMAHPLAADAAVRDLHAAAVADHALVLHAAVLAAGALPVLFGSEDALAEQAVLFWAVGAVVDRLRLLHFAERPTADVVGAGQADLDRRVIVDPIVCRFADTHVNCLLNCRNLMGLEGNVGCRNSERWQTSTVAVDASHIRFPISNRQILRFRITCLNSSLPKRCTSPTACSIPGRGFRWSTRRSWRACPPPACSRP